MSSETLISAGERLHFLWEKFKYHDSLMHSRSDRFWGSQAVMFAILAVLSQSEKLYEHLLVISGVVLPIFGIFGLRIVRIMKVDRLCRNALNDKIWALLRDGTDFVSQQPPPPNAAFDPADNARAENLWHAPTNVTARDVVTTTHVQQLIQTIAWLEIAGGALLLLFVAIRYRMPAILHDLVTNIGVSLTF